MKQAKFIIPFAAAILLAGCATNGNQTSSSDKASVDSSNVDSSNVDSVDSGNDGDSTDIPTPVDVSIDEIALYASDFAKKVDSISGGTIAYSSVDAYSSEETTSDFSYGKDANGETFKLESGDTATYVMKDATGAVITVLKDSDGNYKKASSGDVYDEAAPHFSYYLEYYDSYGVESLLSDVVDAGKKTPNGDFKAINDGEKVVFSFSYFEGSDPLTVYAVNGDFAYPTSSSALTSLNLVIDQYSFANGAYTYDEDTGKAIIVEDAKSEGTITYAITQNVGTRTYTNDVDLSSFAHKGLSFYSLTSDDDGEDVETPISEDSPLSLKVGDWASILIKDTNASATVDFDPLSWTITSGDEDGLSGYISHGYAGDMMSLNADKGGEYVVEVSNSFGVKGTFKVVVEQAKVTSISASLFSLDFNNEVSSKSLNAGDVINAYTDVDIYFDFRLEPYSTWDDLTFTVFDEDWEEIDSEKYDLNINDSIGSGDDAYDAVSFSTSNTGTYWLRVESKEDSDVRNVFQIVVNDSMDFASILTSVDTFVVKDGNGDKKYTFAFTPDSSNDCAGSVVITDLSDESTVTTNYTISKGEDDYDYYRFEFEDDVAIYDMVLGEDRVLYVQLDVDDSTYYRLEDAASSASLPFEKEWKADTDTDGMSFNKVDYLTFYDDGTVYGQITSQDLTYSLKCEYTFVHEGGTYYEVKFIEGDKIEEPENEWFEELPKTVSLDTDTGISLNADYLGVEFLLTPKNS